MTITRLPEIVYPLTQVNKVNEIVDVLNENLNMYYSAENPQLVPVEGVATWTVTHNLGTENVNCSLYNGDNLVISNVSIISQNAIAVSFNAVDTIPAETYKIVIISNGAAGSSSGGSSYTLPVATTSTLGGVKIDGTSITIDDGVISSAGRVVDSTLSSTSTNPVQNKVLYPSLNGFLPDGTVINVKTDGSGDFTKLSDAVNYLTGKWSNGTVTIQLGDGTFNETSPLTINCDFNIPYLIIKGNGTSETTVQWNFTNSSGTLNIKNIPNLVFQSLTFQNATVPTGSIHFWGLLVERSFVVFDTVTTVNLSNAIGALEGARVMLKGIVTCNNAGNGSSGMAYGDAICAQQGGELFSAYGVVINIDKCHYGMICSDGSIIRLSNPTLNITNNANAKVSPTPNTISNNGIICGFTI